VNNRVFISPRRPVANEPLRVIATSTDDPGSVELRIWDPSGAPAKVTSGRLGGPPFTRWARVVGPGTGRWTVVLGNAEKTIACDRFHVRARRPQEEEPADREATPVWEPRWAWEADTENLWSAFVERLFQYPPDDTRTWTNLHDVLRDPDRNLLYDHLGLGEDEQIELEPDCADLPYTLRAYFSWKLRLPFGFRRCTRGRRGRPPTCGALNTSLAPREGNAGIDSFVRFVRKNVGSGVHSSSGRTHPGDDETDLYPVALERASLPPGTVFADPYGHIMVITSWFPQGTGEDGGYGILMAAEAQPDGTVGRRRFWRGSFLFDPSTRDVGAGFKRFRPLQYDRKTGEIRSLTNEELASTDLFARFSMQQYRGSQDDFYDRMEALINPRPLDPSRRLLSLVDALEESVRRRVVAVDNGERFMAERGYRVMEMPEGHAIFETTGPWEDYSTPSRDMRLLISIDTVTGFPDRVSRLPDRFRIAETEAPRMVVALREQLDRELGTRTVAYRKSNGEEQKLTLKQVVARTPALEMAYNPNDCVEIRWGAAEGSAEYASCKRRANAEQRARMKRYRPWFHTRTRPPRGT
jgi:hypothetical protein